MNSAVDPIDSDSGHTPSDDEKKIGMEADHADHVENIGRGPLPPDPDAGYSEEEKARIVCLGNHHDFSISVPLSPDGAD